VVTLLVTSALGGLVFEQLWLGGTARLSGALSARRR
jgi:hypothetical protein